MESAFAPPNGVSSPILDAYPERSYYGGPEYVCPYCHAVFWFQERVKNDSFSTQRKIVYNLCCKGGKVNLKPFECPPPLLADLLKFDGAIDKTINNGTAPYVFKINGVVHHRIGTLLPQRGTQPKFAQLYTYDTEHETQNKLGIFETDDGAGSQPDPEMVSSLLDMLNENNSLVKAFRCARERLEREGDQKITLRLLGCNTRHDVQYSLPSNGEIAAIIVGDYTTGEYTYDVLVHDRECGLKHGMCLSGGSPCKWYINPDVPEASALMASATKAHSPIKWNEVLSSNQSMSHVPEEQKFAYIRDLHPFENKSCHSWLDLGI
ncbi:hypothetical protein Zm00014a_001236 [Zea mays]|uniref:Helicase n=1 Tax=Zea mays TaxID=4577 RepID=A0A3L6DB09_MAIZE|nr:hypothetical protein Zm00014a_001236 [Zea mays]